MAGTLAFFHSDTFSPTWAMKMTTLQEAETTRSRWETSITHGSSNEIREEENACRHNFMVGDYLVFERSGYLGHLKDIEASQHHFDNR